MSRFTSQPSSSDTSTGVKSIIKKEILPSKYQVHGSLTKICNKCHVERSIDYFHWRDHKTKLQKQCNVCRRKIDQQHKTKNVYQYILYLAKRLQYKFGKKLRKTCYLQKEEFVELFIEQHKLFGMKCPYSGVTMTYDLGEGKKETNISIDRFNSDKPYEKGNIIFCCSISNTMKYNSAYHRFIEWCDRLAAHKDDTALVVEYLRKQKGV